MGGLNIISVKNSTLMPIKTEHRSISQDLIDGTV